jgi:hypothetical protein
MKTTDKAILCLCHDETTLRVRQLLLEYFGYRVFPAESLAQVSVLLRQTCPDMFLMDDTYPGLDYELAAKGAKALCPEVLAVVLVPGYGLASGGYGPVDKFLSLDGPREQWLVQLESLFAEREERQRLGLPNS